MKSNGYAPPPGSRTVSGYLRLARDLIFSRLFHRGARLIRQPIYLRGRERIRIGAGLTTGPGCRIEAFGSGEGIKISIGEGVQINDYVHIAAHGSVTLGNHVLIASRVFITDHDHGSYDNMSEFEDPETPPANRPVAISPVVIEDNVWLGEGVCVLRGVTIGRGSIVGANAVAAHNIPPYSIAVGIPARVIKRYNFDKQAWCRV